MSCFPSSDSFEVVPFRVIATLGFVARLYSVRRTLPMPRLLPSTEHLDYIASLLDDMWRIPGTKIRFGLDAIVGWVPGVGDALDGAASCVLVFASWRRGVAPVTLARMVANILLETAVGGVPVVGDIFHVFWKANRRNYRILVREKEYPRSKTWRDWVFHVGLMVGIVAAIAIPIVLLFLGFGGLVGGGGC